MGKKDMTLYGYYYDEIPAYRPAGRDSTALPSLVSRFAAVVMLCLVTSILMLLGFNMMGSKCHKGVAGPLSTWDTACHFGGLAIRKGRYRLTDGNCDVRYPKGEWQPPQPLITYPQAKEDEMYTVFALDPDVPGNPIGTYYLHLLQANVAGADLRKGDFSRANKIASYVGPAPPEGSGFHRYMFVVYRHVKGFMVEDQFEPEDRLMFELKKWLTRYGRGLEGPVAGIQFQADY